MGPELALGPLQMASDMWTNHKNRQFQEQQNKANQQWEWDMYQQKRNDARDDWARQNEYNSPEQQMERLRQAGLNPNLVYGKGADNTAAMVKTYGGGEARGQAPQRQGLNIVGAMQGSMNALLMHAQVKQSQATTDNLAEQNALLKKEGLLKDATTQKVLQDTATSKFGLEQAQSLRDSIIKKAQLDVMQSSANIGLTQAQTDSTKANTLYTLDQNERQKLMQGYNIKQTIQSILESKARVLNMQKQNAKTDVEVQKIQTEINMINTTIENVKKDTGLKEQELELQKAGINKNDNIFWRLMLKGANTGAGSSFANDKPYTNK